MLSGEVPKPFFHHFPGFLEIAFCRARQPYKAMAAKRKVEIGNPVYGKLELETLFQEEHHKRCNNNVPDDGFGGGGGGMGMGPPWWRPLPPPPPPPS